VYAVVKSL